MSAGNVFATGGEDIINDLYYPNQGLCHFAIGLLVFGGLGRIAFWRDEDGLRARRKLRRKLRDIQRDLRKAYRKTRTGTNR